MVQHWLPLFHLCWHSAAGELQLLTLKTWTILVLIQKLCLLWPLQLSALAITAICFDLLGSMAIGMTVPKDQIQNSTGFVYTYGKLLTSIGLPGDLLQKIVGIMLACGIIGELGNWIAGPNQGMYEAAREGTCLNSLPRPLSMVCQSES